MKPFQANYPFFQINGIPGQARGFRRADILDKRGIYGVFHKISPKYLQKYIDEFYYRMNHGEAEDAFETLVCFSVA
ncbi:MULTISPECIES: transposase [unclassified Akkermansia]|uniref:transposase n=1 Tax=unclassified Akkermansia TaxID=2608915 RepID=UPI00083379AC|nr:MULTISPECIES: transposase [unclassified Akkermansia]MBS7153484.1 transposase [Akkermansia sp.]